MTWPLYVVLVALMAAAGQADLAYSLDLLSNLGRELSGLADAMDGTAPGDRVLVHGDLGLHNIALVTGTDEVAGVFDYGDAAWADRHQDFRYLLFDQEGEEMLDAAVALHEEQGLQQWAAFFQGHQLLSHPHTGVDNPAGATRSGDRRGVDHWSDTELGLAMIAIAQELLDGEESQ